MLPVGSLTLSLNSLTLRLDPRYTNLGLKLSCRPLNTYWMNIYYSDICNDDVKNHFHLQIGY